MKKTTDLNIKFLGIIPQYSTKDLKLTPQQVAAFSGLLTFKGDSMDKLARDAQIKKQDINKKVEFILRKSSLRGHASMATMPVLGFSFEGSKMIGSMITGITFSSALMHSGRRAEVTLNENAYPTGILKNKRAFKLYRKYSEQNINVFNQLLDAGIIKDEASKILHYGTYGTGVLSMPVESLVTFLHEWNMEKEWMPEEGGFLLEQLEKNFKKWGVDSLYATRTVAPRNTYAFPNLFKDPKPTNLVRDLTDRKLLKNNDVKVVTMDSISGPGFKARVEAFLKLQKKIFNNKATLKKEWPRLLEERRKLIRDYGNVLNLKVLSRVSWRVWRDKKRHRTAPVTTESIYYCLDEAGKVFKKFQKYFDKHGDLEEKNVKILDQVFAVPPFTRKEDKTRKLYLKAAFDSIQTYRRLVEMGIKPSEAVFIIPRGFRITMVQDYNLHNLIEGYYPLRSCPTADEQLYRLTVQELIQIERELKSKKLGYLGGLLERKCVTAGLCPEEKSCGYIKSQVKGYDDNFHEEMKVNLEDRFQAKLKEIK